MLYSDLAILSSSCHPWSAWPWKVKVDWCCRYLSQRRVVVLWDTLKILFASVSDSPASEIPMMLFCWGSFRHDIISQFTVISGYWFPNQDFLPFIGCWPIFSIYCHKRILISKPRFPAFYRLLAYGALERIMCNSCGSWKSMRIQFGLNRGQSLWMILNFKTSLILKPLDTVLNHTHRIKYKFDIIIIQ